MPDRGAASSLRRLLLAVGLVTVAVALLTLDARATYGARTTADEPQYLLTALSLGSELDLDISDEIAERAYLPFHEVAIDPQTIPLDEAGREISPHDPLLPLLLAVPMRVGGWVAAKAALAVVAGLAAALAVWVAVRRFGVRPGVAGPVVGVAFAGPPLTAYGTQVYPELPAALAVLVGVAALTGELDRRGRLVVIASVVALPWLSVKYAPVAAVLAALLLWRTAVSDRRSARCDVAVLAACGLVYLVVHQRVYGGWTVYAAGDHFVDGELLVVGRDPDYPARSRRLLGLLIDRDFGLASWNPALLALPAGFAALVRLRPPGWVALAGPFAAGWAVATWIALTMHGWWWPGRQVVVVLPLGVIAIAVLVDRLRSMVVPVVVAGLVGTATWLWLVVEASTDRLTLIVDFDRTANPWWQLWSSLLPDLRVAGPGDVVRFVVWALVLAWSARWTWRRVGSAERVQPASVEEDATTFADR